MEVGVFLFEILIVTPVVFLAMQVCQAQLAHSFFILDLFISRLSPTQPLSLSGERSRFSLLSGLLLPGGQFWPKYWARH